MPRTSPSCAARRALASLAALFALACSEAPELARPPSVIVVSLDTLRAENLSLYGYERETTPRLDALARESIVYEQAWSVAPWTLVAHMSMLTGLEPAEHGVYEADRALSPKVPTLAERLERGGYETRGFYFEGWIHPRHGFERGFQQFERHLDAEGALENVRAALAQRNEQLPLFLFLHLFDIHSMPLHTPGTTFYDPPAEFEGIFDADAKELLSEVSFSEVLEGDEALDEPQVAALTALYDANIRYVDDRLGALIEEWRESGLLDESILIVTSDHGEALHQRGSLHGHGGLWEEGLHVPMLVRLPGGARGGERSRVPVSLVDVVPTALDFLGLEREPWLAGRSMLDEEDSQRILLGSKPPIRALLRWPDKLILSRNSLGSRAYRLDEDPLELAPIRGFVEAESARYDELHDALLGAFEEQSARRPTLRAAPVAAEAMSADERAQLGALGYGGELEHD